MTFSEKTISELKLIVQQGGSELTDEHINMLEDAVLITGLILDGDYENSSIIDQLKFRQFVNSFHALSDRDQMIFSTHIKAAFLHKADINIAKEFPLGQNYDYPSRTVFLETLDALLEIKPKGKTGRQPESIVAKARLTLFTLSTIVFESTDLQASDTQDGLFFLFMKAILLDPFVPPALRIEDIRRWIRNSREELKLSGDDVMKHLLERAPKPSWSKQSNPF